MKSLAWLATFGVFSALLSLSVSSEEAKRGKRQIIDNVMLKDEPICASNIVRNEFLRNLSRQSGDLECPESDFIAAMTGVSHFTSILNREEEDYAVLCGNCSVPAKLFVQRCFLYPYQIPEQLDLFDGLCTVGMNDLTCYSAVARIDISIIRDVNRYCAGGSLANNGDVDECSNGCRHALRQMALSLGCCVRLVYGIPATSAYSVFADELIWDVCDVPLPSEDCFAQPGQPPSSSPTGAETEATGVNTDEAMATTGGATAIATRWGTATLMILLASYF